MPCEGPGLAARAVANSLKNRPFTDHATLDDPAAGERAREVVGEQLAGPRQRLGLTEPGGEGESEEVRHHGQLAGEDDLVGLGVVTTPAGPGLVNLAHDQEPRLEPARLVQFGVERLELLLAIFERPAPRLRAS